VRAGKHAVFTGFDRKKKFWRSSDSAPGGDGERPPAGAAPVGTGGPTVMGRHV